MHYFRSFIVTVVVSVSSFVNPTYAACFVCDEVVEMNEDYAKCYLADYEKLLENITNSAKGRAKINLGSCVGDKPGGDRGGLATMPNIDNQSKRLKMIYVFDSGSAVCLKKLLDSHTGLFTPTITFDLYKVCSKND